MLPMRTVKKESCKHLMNRHLSLDIRNRPTYGQIWVHCRKIISQNWSFPWGKWVASIPMPVRDIGKMIAIIGKNWADGLQGPSSY